MPIENFEYAKLAEMERQYSARRVGESVVGITSEVSTTFYEGNNTQVYSAQIFPGVNEPFIMFSRRAHDLNNTPKAETSVEKFILENVLKFHISLPENNEDMRAEGWRIIFNDLIANGVDAFKIIRPSLKMSKRADQRGRDVTIYADANFEKTPQEWSTIIENICNELVQMGMRDYYQPVNSGRRGQTEIAMIQGTKMACYGYEGSILPIPQNDVCYGLAIKLLAEENEPRDFAMEPIENPANVNTP